MSCSAVSSLGYVRATAPHITCISGDMHRHTRKMLIHTKKAEAPRAVSEEESQARTAALSREEGEGSSQGPHYPLLPALERSCSEMRRISPTPQRTLAWARRCPGSGQDTDCTGQLGGAAYNLAPHVLPPSTSCSHASSAP